MSEQSDSHDEKALIRATKGLIDEMELWDYGVRTVLDPACGSGHIVKTLEEYDNFEVTATDRQDKSYGKIRDFEDYGPHNGDNFNWVITNPPFYQAEEFVHRALWIAKDKVAILTSYTFLESANRYERLFSRYRPTIIYQFVERLYLNKGRVGQERPHLWIVWEKPLGTKNTKFEWIAP